MHRLRTATLILLVHSLAVNVVAQQFAWPLPIGSGQTKAFATIQGNVLNSTNGPIADAVVRLRDARTGRIGDTARTDRTGLFVFRAVEPGTYVVELVGADRNVLAASEILYANAGDTLSAIVKLPLRKQPYAGVLGYTTAVLVTATAAAAGIIAVQVTGDAVSPRR